MGERRGRPARRSVKRARAIGHRAARTEANGGAHVGTPSCARTASAAAVADRFPIPRARTGAGRARPPPVRRGRRWRSRLFIARNETSTVVVSPKTGTFSAAAPRLGRSAPSRASARCRACGSRGEVVVSRVASRAFLPPHPRPTRPPRRPDTRAPRVGRRGRRSRARLVADGAARPTRLDALRGRPAYCPTRRRRTLNARGCRALEPFVEAGPGPLARARGGAGRERNARRATAPSVVACGRSSAARARRVRARFLEDEAARCSSRRRGAHASLARARPHPPGRPGSRRCRRSSSTLSSRRRTPRPIPKISLPQPLGLTMIDGDVPNLDCAGWHVAVQAQRLRRRRARSGAGGARRSQRPCTGSDGEPSSREAAHAVRLRRRFARPRSWVAEARRVSGDWGPARGSRRPLTVRARARAARRPRRCAAPARRAGRAHGVHGLEESIGTRRIERAFSWRVASRRDGAYPPPALFAPCALLDESAGPDAARGEVRPGKGDGDRRVRSPKLTRRYRRGAQGETRVRRE